MRRFRGTPPGAAPATATADAVTGGCQGGQPSAMGTPWGRPSSGLSCWSGPQYPHVPPSVGNRLKAPLPDLVGLQTRQAGLEGTGETTLRHLVTEPLR